MKNILLLFLFLVPVFLFAQYPTGTNKSRLGYQTTGDGLIWRGVAADTAIKPRTTANAYFQLDTVNRVLRRYIATQGSWQVVGATPDLSAYLLKSDTAAMLSKYIERGDTALMLTNYVTFGNLSGYPTGTGTADRLARWTATNTLAAGNLSDNATRLQALLPWQFQTYTTAGLPTGVTGYHVYNTTTNGPGWYQGSRWAYGLESTFNRGTATRVPFFDANGQVTDNANLYFLSDQLYVNSIRIGRGNGAVSQNLAIGEGAINGGSVTGNYNTAVGWQALRDLTTGSNNLAIGTLALSKLTSGSFNVGFGPTALQNLTTGSSNLAIGTLALERLVSQDANIAIGASAARYLTGSSSNVAIGSFSLGTQSSNTIGRNTAIGTYAMFSANTQLCTAIGEGSLYSLTSGQENTAVGRFSGYNITTGGKNVLLGIYSGQNETTNSNKLHIANQAAKTLLYGDFNTDQIIINATWPPTLKSSVALEIISTTKGFLPPVMTNAQRTAISSAATGLQVFATDATEGMYLKLATGWKRFLVDGDAATTWLKTELEASRDVDITGGTSTDFRLRSNTRVQFDGKFKLGADSSLYYNPSDKALVLLGSAGFQPSIYQANTYNSFSRAKFEEYDFRAMYSTFSSANGYNFTRGLSDARVGTQWPIIHKVDSSALLNGWGIVNVFGSSFGGARYQHIFEGGADEDELYLISRSDIQGRRAFTIRKNPFAMNVFWVTNEGKIIAGVDSTFKYDPNTDLLQLSKYGTGTKEAADLSKTESVYNAVYATDGTVIERHDKIERYYTITSTSSPQTLSNDYSDNLINQGGTQATFTLTFPASPVDGQVLKITYNNAITTLTLDGNGNTIVGSAVTTGVAGSQRAFKFYTGIGWIKLY